MMNCVSACIAKVKAGASEADAMACSAQFFREATSIVWLLATSIATPSVKAADAPPEGPPVTVVTLKGEELDGAFVGADSRHLTLRSKLRQITLPLNEVSYISFSGRPDKPAAAAPLSYTPPTTPAAQLRAEGYALEQGGRLAEALAKYQEAEAINAADPLTKRALARVRVAIAAEKAAPYKKAAITLHDHGRYGEARACYDLATQLDPYDEDFRDRFRWLRNLWEPTRCPLTAPPAR